jgi:hypothetical protein
MLHEFTPKIRGDRPITHNALAMITQRTAY